MRLDWSKVLVCLVLAMVGFGVVMILSATQSRVESIWENRLFWRQLCWIGIGLAAMVALSRIDYRHWFKLAPYIVGVSMILLLLVFVPGAGLRLNGAARWLKAGPVTFQPSEIAKVALIIASAAMLVSGEVSFKRGFLPIMGLAVVMAAVVVVEPDFGTAALLIVVGLAMTYAGGVRLACIFGSIVPFVAAAAALIVSKPYRVARILAFLSPEDYPETVGYHINQSLIALGSGGTFGVGLGASRQNLYFLPESSTDFIFAIIGEQLGFAGALAVVLAYGVFIYAGLKIASNVKDRFGRLLAYGITVLIGGQAIMNMGVVTACLPTKGISLPFISLGGTGAACMLGITGILANIAMSQRAQEELPEVRVQGAAAGAGIS